jgi:hypothetical protein
MADVEEMVELSLYLVQWTRMQATDMCARLPPDAQPALQTELLRKPLRALVPGSHPTVIGKGSQGLVLQVRLADGGTVARKV